MPSVKTGLSIPTTMPFPSHMTHGQGLAALYMLQDWEAFAGQRVHDPYAPGYFYNHITGVLRGLTNPTRKTALGQLEHATCLVCNAAVDLRRTEGDHLIPKAYGGPETLQNMLVLCRAHNSSKGIKDLLEWWLFKGYPVEQLPRSVLCLYARVHWQRWGVQVHREPLRPWMGIFLQQRAAALPSDEHRIALYGGAFAVCGLAQWLPLAPGGLLLVSAEALTGPYLSAYGMAMMSGGTV